MKILIRPQTSKQIAVLDYSDEKHLWHNVVRDSLLHNKFLGIGGLPTRKIRGAVNLIHMNSDDVRYVTDLILWGFVSDLNLNGPVL